MVVMNFSFTDCGGSFSSTETARKFGTMPRMRFVCFPSRLPELAFAACWFCVLLWPPVCCANAASGPSGISSVGVINCDCAKDSEAQAKKGGQYSQTGNCLIACALDDRSCQLGARKEIGRFRLSPHARNFDRASIPASIAVFGTE